MLCRNVFRIVRRTILHSGLSSTMERLMWTLGVHCGPAERAVTAGGRWPVNATYRAKWIFV